MTNRATIDQLAEWLKAQDDIALLGHVSPDGDAAGSNLAVWHALKALGRRAVVCLPGGIPNMYRALPGADAVVDTEAPLPFEPKAALSIDVSDLGRLGEAGQRIFESAPARASLDHHHTNPGMGDMLVLDGDAAAAGEIVVDLIDALGVSLTPDMATCLFVAISTDCGQFSYTNTRAKTFRAAARCAEAGIDVDRITERLYRTRSMGRTKLLGLALSGLEVSPDGRMAWARLTEDMLTEAGALREDNEGIVNYLIEIEGVQFAALAEQRGETTKLSLRSKAPLNVARDIAAPLGGGGHECAAGCTLETDIDAALRQVLALAREKLEPLDAPGELDADNRGSGSKPVQPKAGAAKKP